jgi:phage gpG-like protein
MDINELENNIVRDLAVELADEFDQNFERKAFFDEKWPAAKLTNPRGSLLMRSGNYRRSIEYNVNDEIYFSSSLPYASLHNEGGEITVTEKMKRYFWAMHKNTKGTEAQQYKALALMKVGHVIRVPKRQVVGDHPEVGKIVERIVNDNIEQFNQELKKLFEQ